MAEVGYNDNVQVYGRKFHVQTASSSSRGIASCEIFEEGRLINKNYITFERRNRSDSEKLENRIRSIISDVHQDTIKEIQVLFTIAEKIKKLKHAPSHVKMGLLFIHNNLVNDAIDHFKEAISINPKEIDAYNNLGLTYIKSANYQEALSVFLKALQINNTYADIHHNLGITYVFEKQHYKALEHLQQALRINKNYHIARYNLCLLYIDSILSDPKDTHFPPVSVRVERAIQQIHYLIKANVPGAKNILSKVQKLLSSKDVDGVVKFLIASREKLFPDDKKNIIGISFYLRFMYSGKSLNGSALKKFEKELTYAITAQGDYADLWNNLGIVHLIQCRNLFVQALNEFNKALELNPKFEKALKNKKLVENDGKEFLILLRAILK